MNEQEQATYAEFLSRRRQQILERIERAATKANRAADEVMLVAVSKTVGCDELGLAYNAGYRTFGENRPQELKRKVQYVREHEQMAGVRFDMIGNLQTNKINQVLGNAQLVHSVSSVHLAEAIARRSAARNMVTDCLMEVNVSGEASKSGFTPDEARAAIESLRAMEGIAVKGLMTMAPARNDAAARATFSGLRELRDELRASTGLELGELSCGMSGDFEIAVEEGSTMVRLGRIVFDPTYADSNEKV